MKIVLLPGLDGTGYLFEDLLQHLPSTLEVEVVSYTEVTASTYSNQAKEIAQRFQGDDLFVVGESYSGPVAYELYYLLGSQVKGIVFLASFISPPSIYSRFASMLPTSLLKPNFLSRFLLYAFGFNLTGGSSLINPVFHSLECADKQKLKERLHNISSLKKPSEGLGCPVTYIQPSRDLLVSNRSVQELAALCPSFNKVEVSGGHFIAQFNPVTCAKIISHAIENHTRSKA